MKRAALTFALLLALAGVAHAFGLGLGNRFGKEGASGNKGATVIVGCASPTAPNGVVDLSQCSNAFYAATIF